MLLTLVGADHRTLWSAVFGSAWQATLNDRLAPKHHQAENEAILLEKWNARFGN
jgi:hypothetical protein